MWTAWSLAAVVASAIGSNLTTEKPNLILLVIDDLGHNDVGWGNNRTVGSTTPIRGAHACVPPLAPPFSSSASFAPLRVPSLDERPRFVNVQHIQDVFPSSPTLRSLRTWTAWSTPGSNSPRSTSSSVSAPTAPDMLSRAATPVESSRAVFSCVTDCAPTRGAFMSGRYPVHFGKPPPPTGSHSPVDDRGIEMWLLTR